MQTLELGQLEKRGAEASASLQVYAAPTLQSYYCMVAWAYLLTYSHPMIAAATSSQDWSASLARVIAV